MSLMKKIAHLFIFCRFNPQSFRNIVVNGDADRFLQRSHALFSFSSFLIYDKVGFMKRQATVIGKKGKKANTVL